MTGLFARSVATGIRLVVATLAAIALAATPIAVGCGGEETAPEGRSTGSFGSAPEVPRGALDPEVAAAATALARLSAAGEIDDGALQTVAGSGDARLGWLVSDLLRFAPPGPGEDLLVAAFDELAGTDLAAETDADASAWLEATDRLIAWDLPAPPSYRRLKAAVFTAVEPGWEPFFADASSRIDWRLISWGGVLIDDRPFGDPGPCPHGCIPALDDPALTEASDADWYPDGRTVFGVVVRGEAVALPKNIMEVHEMVNMTIGGRRLGIPYCTLCGSAQAYFTDSVPERLTTPVLRTSGLLSRSNKVMYDLRTRSVFDTFTGKALSGPMREAGVTLEQTAVVASTWGAWKRDHRDTRIIAEDGGIGRSYPADPLGGRDDDGPIFPVGDVDPRLPVQEEVVGAIAPGGQPVAFPVDAALAAIERGEDVGLAGVSAVADGDGLRLVAADGRELPAHQAFWFAWSQFNPGTEVWSPQR